MNTKLNTLNDGLIDSVKDIYSAEIQLLKALPKMEKKATTQKLKEAFRAHILETEGQVERLDDIGILIEEKMSGKTCKAMLGLVEEANEIMEEESENKALIDALLIGTARRLEHYEIAAYGTAHTMAKELGQSEVAKLLEETLAEEIKADNALSLILEDVVAPRASCHSNNDDMEPKSKQAQFRKSDNQKRSVVAARVLSLIICLLMNHQFASATPAESKQKNLTNKQSEAVKYKSDNSGRNIQDRNSAQVTSDDQGMTRPDMEILARIRKEIVANKDLSINAHNVKIVVENHIVTLRGPVGSLEEKTWIQDASTSIAKGYSIINNLEVTPS